MHSKCAPTHRMYSFFLCPYGEKTSCHAPVPGLHLVFSSMSRSSFEMSDASNSTERPEAALSLFRIQGDESLPLPYAEEGVRTGFPSPTQSTMESTIDLNKDLIDNPESTFYARVEGDSMSEANIHEGDILIIDRSIHPSNGDIALCVVDGEFTVKYIEIHRDHALLRPANPKYPVIRIDENDDFSVWGVVTYVIHRARRLGRFK